MLLGVFENGEMYFVRTDHIGRPVFATDDTGTKVWEASYLPFGGVQTTSGPNSDLRFPGQWFQAETGLHQNWMRDYDPTTGRYIQADPLGLVDGASVYGYALQNPGRYVDPRGEAVWFAAAAKRLIIGAAAGYATNKTADYIESIYCSCDDEAWNSDVLSAAAGASAADGFSAKVPKGGATWPGASSGTSYQSKYLSQFANRYLPRSSWPIPTPTGIGRGKFWRQTTNIGRAAGRWAPYVSSAYIGYDMRRIFRCLT